MPRASAGDWLTFFTSNRFCTVAAESISMPLGFVSTSSTTIAVASTPDIFHKRTRWREIESEQSKFTLLHSFHHRKSYVASFHTRQHRPDRRLSDL